MLIDNINLVLNEMKSDDNRAHYSVLDKSKSEIERLRREVGELRLLLNSPLNSADHKFKSFLFDLMVNNKIKLEYYPDGTVDGQIGGATCRTYNSADIAIIDLSNK